MRAALEGVRVVEVAGHIAGPYCAKLLTDLGAEVVKIEPRGGDPLRRWGPFPGGVSDPNRCGMFEYLNGGKHGVTVDPACPQDVAMIRELIAGADILVQDCPTETSHLPHLALATATLDEVNPRLVVVRISSFGQKGPWRDREATPLTIQAASGWITTRDPDRPPVQGGARIAEYVAGAYGALGALTALRTRTDRTSDAGHVVEVDVSVLESLLSTLPYPMLMAERMRKLGFPSETRAGPMLGIVRAADGWIGINCLTGQHWLDVCAMIGLPEYGEHQIAIMMGGRQRAEFFAKAQPWLTGRSVAEIVELSQALRIPAAPVNDGATALECPQYIKRGFFIEAGGDGWSFRRPGAAFRLSKTPVPGPRPAPRLGTPRAPAWAPRLLELAGTESDGHASLPFAGLKVLDLSTFWAGAYLTCYLGAFGADIVKVESIQRPDGHRYSGAYPHEGERWYEHSALWQATNLNKRDITLDLTSERGRELASRLATEADVVVENFSPRVVEQFGLDYDSLTSLRPNVIMIRMPGFGLDGPWRDYVGWALNIEQTSGMSAVTGHADGPPCNLQGPADPIVGVHAGVALLAALEHRRRTSEGQLIEVAQIEVAACVTAEPVIEYSMNGFVRAREGNRQRGRVQGVYPTGGGEWVAVCVRDDNDWSQLLTAMGRADLLTDPRFILAEQREAAHDAFDELLADWTKTRTAAEIVDTLQERHVPAERLLATEHMYDVAQLNARGYYEELEHPITGLHRYPGWPFRITPGPAHHHRFVPPTLGQHNAEVLRGIGVTTDQLRILNEQGIIGTRPLNA